MAALVVVVVLRLWHMIRSWPTRKPLNNKPSMQPKRHWHALIALACSVTMQMAMWNGSSTRLLKRGMSSSPAIPTTLLDRAAQQILSITLSVAMGPSTLPTAGRCGRVDGSATILRMCGVLIASGALGWSFFECDCGGC